MQFENHRVLVTAAGNGIGLAVVNAFLAEGARVHGVDLSEDACDALAKRQGDDLRVSCCDVSVPAQVDALFRDHQAGFGGLDILVNCAGIKGPTGPVESLDYEDWQACITVNLDATFLCARAAVPMLRAAREAVPSFSPSITSMSSTAGWHGYANRSAYSAAKWAVIGLTKSIAMELGPEGIRANAVCPGSVNGERMDRVIADESRQSGLSEQAIRERYTSGVSMRSFIDPEDIASTVLFLASPAAGKLTGQAISVDGHLENFGNG